MGAVSLLLHDVIEDGDFGSSGFQSPDANTYKLDHSHFEKILNAIGRRVKPSASINPGVLESGDSKSVFFTFDDGGSSAYPRTADMLEQHGWRGLFFISTDFIGKKGFLAPKDLRTLRRRGHWIGSHSCSHPVKISACTSAELDREWGKSVRVLSEILGEPVYTASVPGGFYTKNVAESATAKGIKVLFNSEPTTRVTWVNGCLILGRYSVKRGASPETVAALAAGDLFPRLSQSVFWNAKKAAKAAGGQYWFAMRRRILARRKAA